MSKALLRALNSHLVERNFEVDGSQEPWVKMILSNGVILAGVLVSRDAFNEENAGGSFPDDFAFDAEFSGECVYLSKVYTLGGSGNWESIGTLCIPIADVLASGDRAGIEPPEES